MEVVKEKREGGRGRWRNREGKLETAIYSRPNPIQAIRRNNLAYGESVTLYPGGGVV